MTLRARLIILLTVVVAVVGATGAAVAITQRQYLIEQVDGQLRSAGEAIAHIPFGVKAPPGLPPAPASDTQVATGQVATGQVATGQDGSGQTRLISDLWIAVIRPDGTVQTFDDTQLRGSKAPVIDVAQARAHAIDGKAFDAATADGNSGFRMIALPGARGDGILTVGLSLDRVDTATNRLWIDVAVAVGVMMLVVGLLGWWVWRLGLRPIRRMTATARSITRGELDHRVEPQTAGTEAAHLGAAINSMLDERQRTEDRLRRFVGDASHELRTPLTSIRGYTDLFERQGLTAPGALDDAMRRIKQESIRMSDLVDELLLLTQLDQNRPLADEPVDVGQLLRDAADDASASAPGRNIVVSTSAPLVVAGDENRLRQVISGLVTNALVHTTSTVTLRGIAAGDGQAIIEVADDGPGMPPDVAAKAFERFFRGDPSRARGRGGSGLGLAIVESIVTAHGGSVELRSTEHDGTVVRVVLPEHSQRTARVP